MATGTPEQVAETFRRLDASGDGQLQVAEFHDIFKAIGGSAWPDDKIVRLFKVADIDKNGAIDINEFLKWVFKKKAGRKAVLNIGSRRTSQDSIAPVPAEADATDSDGNYDTDGSISGESNKAGQGKGSGDAVEKVKTKAGKKAATKSKKEVVISGEQLYETFVYLDGRVQPRLPLNELVEAFAKCKRAGFGLEYARLVKRGLQPQAQALHDPEDLSAFEVGHLAILAHDEPDATEEDAWLAVARASAACRALGDHESLSSIGLDPASGVGCAPFTRLLPMISAVMSVEVDCVSAQLLWASTDIFELTTLAASCVLERVFLKTDAPKRPLMKQKVSSSEFLHMCQVQQLADNSGTTGIPESKLPAVFADILKRLPDLIPARRAKMQQLRGKAKKKAKKSRESRTYTSVSGRQQLSILFEELFRAMPARAYKSPLHLVLSLLEGADSRVA